MSTLSQLRKNMSNLDGLTQKLQEGEKKTYAADTRYWKPTLDKAGNGYAVIRFLPPAQVDGEDGQLWVQLWSHAFQGPTGAWYIENSLTTLNQNDPVAEYNRKLWATGTKENQDIVRKQKRKLSYISNVMVVNDPANPENNGKVFLFKYGKKIFDKLKEAMQPPFPDKQPINPFDFWNGANFKLKVRKGDGGYPNYDLSEFDAPTALSDDDKRLNDVWKACHSLKAEVAADKFKKYDELKERLDKVLGDGSTGEINNLGVVPTTTVSPLPPRQTGPVAFTDVKAPNGPAKFADPVLSEFQTLADQD